MNYVQAPKHLIDLTEKAQKIHAEERRISLESIRLVGELEQRKAWFALGMSLEKYAVHIGLTPSKYFKRAAAARVFAHFPGAVDLFELGEIDISHLSMMAGRITEANAELILNGLRGTSKREAEAFLSRVTPQGQLLDREGYTEITIRLTDSEREIFERAREVLAHGGHVPSHAEIIVRATGDLLEKRDPMKRAQRAAERLKNSKSSKTPKTNESHDDKSAEGICGEMESCPGEVESGAGDIESSLSKVDSCPGEVESGAGEIKSRLGADESRPTEVHNPRKALPQTVRNAVWIRDEGQCTYVHGDGSRCTNRMMLELDHILMVCRGGTNEADNLRLRCCYHNRHTAEESLRTRLPRRFG